MYFNHRIGHRCDGIAQRVAVMGEGAGVEDRTGCPVMRLVKSVNQRSLIVGLKGAGLGATFRGSRLQLLINLGQSGAAVRLGLPVAGKVQVRTVQNQNARQALSPRVMAIARRISGSSAPKIAP